MNTHFTTSTNHTQLPQIFHCPILLTKYCTYLDHTSCTRVSHLNLILFFIFFFILLTLQQLSPIMFVWLQANYTGSFISCPRNLVLSTAKGSTGTHLVQQFQVQIVACAPLDESHRGSFAVQKEHSHKSLTNATLPNLRELLLCNMVSTRPIVSIISQYEVVFEYCLSW